MTTELGGIPDKLTPERAERICHSISRRVPKVLAAEAEGVTERTFYNWLERGRNDIDAGLETKFAAFFQRVRKTESDLITGHTDRISSGEVGWQSQSWLLERLSSKYFGANAALTELEARITKMEQDNVKDKE